MGVLWWYSSAVLVRLLLGGCCFCLVSSAARVERAAVEKSVTGVCDIPGCNCSDTAKIWKIINCTFNSTQAIELLPGTVPKQAMEISIIGGETLTVKPSAFDSMVGFNLLRVDGTRNFVIHRQAFTNLSASSLLVQVQHCNRFILESNGFKNMQTPIIAEISSCNQVTIKNSAFGRLQAGKFYNVQTLDLEEGAFTFENQGQIGRHGPVTNLSFLNVRISEIPKSAFLSVLAEVNIQDSIIKNIHSEAFKASQISSVSIVNTTIHRLQTGAFSGQSLIFNFVLSKCIIHTLETQAIMAAFTNFTVQHSIITDIQLTGITSVASNFHITDNQFKTIQEKAFVLSNFNRVYFNHNIMLNIEKSFITFDVITDDEVQEVTFVGNEIHNAKLKSLNFISHLPKHTAIKFDDNSFSQQCYCDMGKWLRDLFDNSEMNVDFALDTSFCKVSKTLSHCFKLNEGLINMKNFTELVCGNETEIYCEPYHGETKTLDTTATMLFDEMEESINSNMYIGIALGTLLILAVCGTVVILLIRGGIWLKRNGYCMHFRNIRLTQGEPSHDDERVMVDLERNGPKNDDNELTPELLMRLREALNDPDDDIKEQARERIEKLYERYITSDSYTNNNRQDEETHLYEELGNLQNGHGHQSTR
ncbi:hypothetical protein QE152_g1823 [Popillia japonica]|uniref:Right handed beta helix domain-containing protein n=1 Tax=Popillia japonica TaxID=7064 RepID=A0AAW1N7R7_POPJA